MALVTTGFTNYTGWSHHTNDQSPSQICTYSYSSKKAYLSSVVVKLGTGKNGSKFTNSSGTVVTGNGKAISAKVHIYNGSNKIATSNTISVTKEVSSSSSSGSYYANVAECSNYTFTFNSTVELNKSTTYTLKIEWSGGNVLCFAKGTTVQGDITYDDGVIYIYVNGAWKKAIPYVFYSSSWHKAAPYIFYSGSWRKCSG